MIEYIGKGRENATPRIVLSLLTGWSDRKVRKEIEILQSQGTPICNFQDGSGYFIAKTKQEFERYTRQEYHRATQTIKKINKMKAWFRE